MDLKDTKKKIDNKLKSVLEKVEVQEKVEEIVKKYEVKETAEKALLPVLLLFAALMRVVGLFAPNLIFDEGYTVLAVRGILERGLPILPSGILYPRGIAYSYISAIIDFVIRNEVVAVRLVSAIAGVITVWGIYLLTEKLLLSKKAAFLAAVLSTFSIYLIEASRYGRFYSLMLLGFVFATYFALRVFDENGKPVFKDIICMLGFSILTIFSDSLGVGVVIPIGVIVLMGILKRSTETFENPGVIRWIKKYWFVFMFLIVFVGVAGVLQFWLERYTFYSTYRKLIDDENVRSNLLNLPLSFSPSKFGGFLVAILRNFWLEAIFLVIALTGLKLKLIGKEKMSTFVFLLLTSFGFFTFVVLVAPQFQIRFFYILYVLLTVLGVGVIQFIEEKLRLLGLLKFATVFFLFCFLVFLPILPVEKYKGSFSESEYLPSSSLDYFPDSENAFKYVIKNEVGEDALLFSTYRKELAYYGKDFKGMKFVVVPYQLENSLKSMPLDIYREHVAEDRRKDLTREVAAITSLLGTPEKDILVDPVTGEIIVRPEDLIRISALTGGNMYVITSRFDYNSNYVSEKYLSFLEGNKHKVVYRAEDEEYSNVYGF